MLSNRRSAEFLPSGQSLFAVSIDVPEQRQQQPPSSPTPAISCYQVVHKRIFFCLLFIFYYYYFARHRCGTAYLYILHLFNLADREFTYLPYCFRISYHRTSKCCSIGG
uniref:Uncharacterized protein n=1 Tax=Schizaphis graminum TaxID=13262 RepID=A0A2S2NZM7_SCHGA